MTDAYILEGAAKFQFEVGENTDAIFFPPKFTDTLNVVHRNAKYFHKATNYLMMGSEGK